MPSSRGIRADITTRSGTRRKAARTPFTPSPAVSSAYPAEPRTMESIPVTVSLSSTRRTRNVSGTTAPPSAGGRFSNPPQQFCYGRRRHRPVDGAAANSLAGHAEDDARLLVLRKGEPSGTPDVKEPLGAVRSHPGEKNADALPPVGGGQGGQERVRRREVHSARFPGGRSDRAAGQ